MKKKYAFVFAIITLVLILFVYIVVFQNPTTALRKDCPDEWIENRMPGLSEPSAAQYFIIDGERKEIDDFDLPWIKSNCSVQIQYAY